MEAEVSELIGAERGERTAERATHRNGYRCRRWDTPRRRARARLSQAAQGQLLSELPSAPQRSEQALVAAVQEA